MYSTCADQQDYEKQFLALWREAFAGDRQNGTSAAVYTELTDIEGEVNGLMTYDRKVVKANVDLFRKALAKRERLDGCGRVARRGYPTDLDIAVDDSAD